MKWLNKLSHLYDEATSRKIYEMIKNKYVNEFIKLKDNLQQELENV